MHTVFSVPKFQTLPTDSATTDRQKQTDSQTPTPNTNSPPEAQKVPRNSDHRQSRNANRTHRHRDRTHRQSQGQGQPLPVPVFTFQGLEILQPEQCRTPTDNQGGTAADVLDSTGKPNRSQRKPHREEQGQKLESLQKPKRSIYNMVKSFMSCKMKQIN